MLMLIVNCILITLGVSYAEGNAVIITFETDPVARSASFGLDEVIQKIIYTQEQNVLNKLEEIIEKRFTSIENQLNQKMYALQKNMEVNTDRVAKHITALENEQHIINIKFDKTDMDVSCNCCISNNTLMNDMVGKLDEIQKNTNNNVKIMDALQKLDKDIQVYRNRIEWDSYKQVVIRGYGYDLINRIDDPSLKHVKIIKDSNGDITYFEMHLGIKGKENGLILLSELPNPSVNDYYYDIVVGANGNTGTRLRRNTLDNGKYRGDGYHVVETKTPNILSAFTYKLFYIKIDAGKLVFGEKGSSTPIISHFDENLKKIKYFGLSAWDKTTVTFVYDLI